jgi:hypothetical protein
MFVFMLLYRNFKHRTFLVSLFGIFDCSKVTVTAFLALFLVSILMKPCRGIAAAAAHEDAQEVKDEVEEKKRHLNVVFIGHVGKLSFCTACFVSTIFQGQLDRCTRYFL